MPTYDCRKSPAFGSVKFPCPVKVLDARTNERIPEVFFLDTITGRIGRRVRGADGRLLLHPAGHHVEVWEHLRWRAVSLADGIMIAQSEGPNEQETTA